MKRFKKLLLPAILATGCITAILCISQNAFHPQTVLYETMPGRALALTNAPQNNPAPPKTDASGTPWHLTLINRRNPIPESFKASEIHLADVPGGEKVDERIYEPLMEMLDAAQEWNPIVVSGYRTQKTQQHLYDEKISKYRKQGYSEKEAAEQAQQWVAVPGFSEHQLGLAVDINGSTYDIYLWLQENSWKYGFIFRYPGNKTDITGVAEEVWHYRYVGKEAAKEIHEQGICLEEYLAEFEE